MTTAIYARISDDRSDGAGVERQIEDCRRLCQERNYDDVVLFVDNSLSASVYATKPRLEYQKLLILAKTKKITRIVTYNLDRLYRQPRELEAIIELDRVEVISLHGDLDLTTGEGKFAARIMVSMAAKSSDDTSRRMRRRNQQARDNGIPLGGTRAFGWRNGMTPDPVEAPLVAQAILDITRGVSLTDIAKSWNRAGVKQVRGVGGWKSNLVKTSLTNPRHIGIVGRIVNTNEWTEHGPAKWPAIVDEQTFRACAATLDTRTHQVIPRRRSLLTGLIICAICGRNMQRFTRSAGHFAYRCSRVKMALNGTGCGHISIAADLVESVVTEATFDVVDNSDMSAFIHRKDDGDLHWSRLRELELIAADMEQKYASGKLPSARFDRLIAANDAEQAKVKTALAAQLASTASAEAVTPYAGKPGMLAAAWPNLTDDQRRSIIAIAIRKVVIHKSTPGLVTDPRRIVLG